jgi:hypothetical protein
MRRFILFFLSGGSRRGLSLVQLNIIIAVIGLVFGGFAIWYIYTYGIPVVIIGA